MKRIVFLILLGLFALVTLFLSSSLLFDLFDVRDSQGDFIPIIAGANFLCAIIYFGSLIALLKQSNWGISLLWIAFLILLISSIIFVYLILNGTVYETKTIGALLFRLGVTYGFILSFRK